MKRFPGSTETLLDEQPGEAPFRIVRHMWPVHSSTAIEYEIWRYSEAGERLDWVTGCHREFEARRVAVRFPRQAEA